MGLVKPVFNAALLAGKNKLQHNRPHYRLNTKIIIRAEASSRVIRRSIISFYSCQPKASWMNDDECFRSWYGRTQLQTRISLLLPWKPLIPGKWYNLHKLCFCKSDAGVSPKSHQNVCIFALSVFSHQTLNLTSQKVDTGLRERNTLLCDQHLTI